MKTIYKVLTALSLLVFFCHGFNLSSKTPTESSPNEGPIIIRDNGTAMPGGPRSQPEPPIHGWYTEAAVTLWFDLNLGTAIITLINCTTGEHYEEIADTSVGMAELPITGTAGHYVLTIRLSTGAGYGGEFTL